MILCKNYNQERIEMSKNDKKKAILDRQFQMAMEGSIEMLKWVGIQLCGQDNKPTKASEPLPTGFNVSLVTSREQEEYEENREDFYAWKMEREMRKTMAEANVGRRKYEESKATSD